VEGSQLPRVNAGATVFRLVKNVAGHFPPDAVKPLPGAFKITETDMADGRARGIPALFSVYNASRTSIACARTLRAQEERDSTPFCWSVNSIHAISGFKEVPLEVLCDPDPWHKGPGARGHCGVAGLVRGYEEPKGADKLVVKAIRSALIDACERFDPERHPSPSSVVRWLDRVACRAARLVAAQSRRGP
jgi:hypothetical protein